MTARVLPRDYGVVIECNRCGATERTAMTGRKRNRAWVAGKGWGRGSDPGSLGKPPRYGAEGAVTREAVPGRPRTTAHDLCPPCLKLDREATAARKQLRIEQRAAARAKRDAARKAA